MTKKRQTKREAVTQQIIKNFKLPKRKKKPRVEVQELIAKLPSLYTTDGDNVLQPQKAPDVDAEVAVLETDSPTQGIPRPPKRKPTGTYYSTEPGDFAYAPVPPSDGHRGVSSAPDVAVSRKKRAERHQNELERNASIEVAVDALQKVAEHSVSDINTKEMIALAEMINQLRAWRRAV